LPSGDEVKTKNPPPSGSGLINFVNESKPDCRAGQQRVRKQQVQVLIHANKLTNLFHWSNAKMFLTFH
jgi:hypothetical protein